MFKEKSVSKQEFLLYLKNKSNEKFRMEGPDESSSNNFSYGFNSKMTCKNTSFEYLQTIGVLYPFQSRKILQAWTAVNIFEKFILSEKYTYSKPTLLVRAHVHSIDIDEPLFSIESVTLSGCGLTVSFNIDRTRSLFRINKNNKDDVMVTITVSDFKTLYNEIFDLYLDGLKSRYGITREMFRLNNIDYIRNLIEMIEI